MKLKKLALAISADSKEKEIYVKYCDDLDMDPAWVECQFKNKITQREFTLLGLNKKSKLFTVVVKPFGTEEKEVYSIKQFMENCEPIYEN